MDKNSVVPYAFKKMLYLKNDYCKEFKMLRLPMNTYFTKQLTVRSFEQN